LVISIPERMHSIGVMMMLSDTKETS